MTLRYLGKRWFGLAVGVTRSTIHLASIGVLRDDETGEIHERIYRPACRMPSQTPIITIPIQASGMFTPTCKLCKTRISPGESVDLDERNAALFAMLPGDPEFQAYAADPEQYLASERGIDDASLFRAKLSDTVSRMLLGEASSYLTTHEAYPVIRCVLLDLPTHPTSTFVVRDLMDACPDDRDVVYRLCTAALAMHRVPSGRRRFPVDVLFRTTEKAKL